ncbi:MAG TPA: ROK family protein [Gemmataceae bacterium]|nr:ROK family protein [Gemmataceae bacterium]
MGKYVGLDVGGTSMKAAVVDDTGRDFPGASLPTEAERGQAHGLATMCETIRKAVTTAGLSMSGISAIGVATPGTMDLNTGMMLEPPNMKPWRNVPVRQHIAETFKLPTAFQNDANAAAFGEYWVGAGRGAKSLVFFTLGTGVGGGIIIFDRVLEGEHSHGGELGHMKIEMTNPRECGCGKFGCLEAYASATSVVKRTEEALAKDGGKSKLHSWPAKDGGLTAEDVFNAAKAGDKLAQEIVDRTAFYLAMGAANVMHVIDPEMVVFGGGMIEAGEPFLNLIRHYVKQIAFPVPAERTEIRYAQLGSKAGVIGAAACARLLVAERGIST